MKRFTSLDDGQYRLLQTYLQFHSKDVGTATVGKLSTTSACPGASSDFRWNASIVEWLAGIFVAPPSINAVVGYRGRMGAILFQVLAEEPGCHPGVQRMRSALTSKALPPRLRFNLGARSHNCSTA